MEVEVGGDIGAIRATRVVDGAVSLDLKVLVCCRLLTILYVHVAAITRPPAAAACVDAQRIRFCTSCQGARAGDDDLIAAAGRGDPAAARTRARRISTQRAVDPAPVTTEAAAMPAPVQLVAWHSPLECFGACLTRACRGGDGLLSAR